MNLVAEKHSKASYFYSSPHIPPLLNNNRIVSGTNFLILIRVESSLQRTTVQHKTHCSHKFNLNEEWNLGLQTGFSYCLQHPATSILLFVITIEASLPFSEGFKLPYKLELLSVVEMAVPLKVIFLTNVVSEYMVDCIFL